MFPNVDTQEEDQELKLKIKVSMPNQIYQVLVSSKYFVCAGESKIYVYSIQTKERTTIKVCTSDFKLVSFPPFLFACFISQFIYFYTEEALHDVSRITKIKISKMNIRCMEFFNKGYFMGGYNRSPFPGGNLIDKRTIYYLENLTPEHKNKPLWEINIPKSKAPVSLLLFQNPYLIAYCEPNVYVINPYKQSILISFQKEFLEIIMLEGRYAMNCLNMLAISLKQKSLISVDVEKYPIYGVELNQFPEKAIAVSQAKNGLVYAGWKN